MEKTVIPLSYACANHQIPFWNYAFQFDIQQPSPGWVFLIIAVISLIFNGASNGISGTLSGLSSCFLSWLIIVYFCYNCNCNISWALIALSVLCMISACINSLFVTKTTTQVTTEQKVQQN